MDMPTSDLLKLATIYSAFSSGYYYKIKQIQKYDWMEDVKLDDAVDRLELVINKNARFEVEVSNPELKVGKVIVGRMDCMDGDTIWEFKCTRELDSDHFIQLAIYALLNENMREAKIRDFDKKIKQMELDMNKREELEKVHFKKVELGNILLIGNIKYTVYHIDINGLKIQDDNKNKKLIRESHSLLPRIVKKGNIKDIEKIKENKKFLEDIKFKYKLMNILTNEICEIKFEKDKLDEMLNFLLYHKYKGTKKFTDDEFINDLLNDDINIEELIEINENIATSAFID
jgi:hypothetical protein